MWLAEKIKATNRCVPSNRSSNGKERFEDVANSNSLYAVQSPKIETVDCATCSSESSDKTSRERNDISLGLLKSEKMRRKANLVTDIKLLKAGLRNELEETAQDLGIDITGLHLDVCYIYILTSSHNAWSYNHRF